MKRSSFIIAILILSAIAITSCTNYIDTLSSRELASVGEAAFTTDGGTKILDEDFILELSDSDIDYLRDFTVIKANDAKNINEIGIFRVESGKADDMRSLVTVYVENLKKQYSSMQYFPEEAEKYELATVKVFGNYVVYSFLNESDTEAFYDAVENAIRS